MAEEALRDSWVRHRLHRAEEHLPGNYLPVLLEGLALSGMEEGIVYFPAARLEAETDKVLEERGYSGGERDREKARLLRAAQDVIGVLVEQGPDLYGFLHLTFQEFYASRALVNLSDRVSGVIRRRWSDPNWREVWLLYGLGVQSDRARHEQLFRCILESAHPLDGHLHREKILCLALAGIGRSPLPRSADRILEWAAAELVRSGAVRDRVISVLSGWERAIPLSLGRALLDRLRDEDARARRTSYDNLARSLTTV